MSMLVNDQTATTPQPAAPPGAPAAPAAPEVAQAPATISLEGMSLAALEARKSELSNQITSASRRRDEAVRDLRSSPDGAARAGLEGRIAVLDQRIMRLESDIEQNGQAIIAARARDAGGTLVPPSERFGPFSSKQLMALSVMSIIAIWGPLAFALARVMVRRWAHPRPAPQVLESAERLERMEQAIDAVAIEVERISEGQRFVTQSLAKRDAAPALGVGQAPAEPIRVGEAQAVVR